MRSVVQNEENPSCHPTKGEFCFLPEQFTEIIETNQMVKEKAYHLKGKPVAKRRLAVFMSSKKKSKQSQWQEKNTWKNFFQCELAEAVAGELQPMYSTGNGRDPTGNGQQELDSGRFFFCRYSVFSLLTQILAFFYSCSVPLSEDAHTLYIIEKTPLFMQKQPASSTS